MTSRNATKQASALATARHRRRELDKTRDTHDQQVEQATADALLSLELRTDADRALQSANDGLGQALRSLLEEDVSIERAAALLELDATEVRRLTKHAAPSTTGAEPRPAAGADG
jgi:DNA-directed RNA polymerase specialized sigma24 family protein